MTSDDNSTPGFADAMAELDTILEEIEADDVDVDRLSAQVSRAADLIALCRDRIAGTRVEVERVVATLEGDESGE